MSKTSPHALLVALGKRLRALREKQGLTQAELSEALGMSRTHISQLETGAREVGLVTLQVMARGLKTTMAKLLRGL